LKYGNDKSNVKVLTSQDEDFYEPYQTDADGKEPDTIIDWAGVPNDSLEIKKYRAVMLTLAANYVFEKKTCDDFWEARILWLEGKYGVMCNKRDQEMCTLSESRKIQ
jgi:hypothetical protein